MKPTPLVVLAALLVGGGSLWAASPDREADLPLKSPPNSSRTAIASYSNILGERVRVYFRNSDGIAMPGGGPGTLSWLDGTLRATAGNQIALDVESPARAPGRYRIPASSIAMIGPVPPEREPEQPKREPEQPEAGIEMP